MGNTEHKTRPSSQAWSRRLPALLLIVAFLFPAGIAGAGDPLVDPGPTPTPGLDLVPATAPAPEGPQTPSPPGTGFIPPPMDLSHLTGQRLPRGAMLEALPAQFDWRDQGKVTPVRDQGECGSCYAFATLANFESRLLIEDGGAFNLSENNAKECNWRELTNFEYPPGRPWGSCKGGNGMMLANLFSQKGIVLESCDPYVASDVACKTTCPYQQTLLDWRLISGRIVPDTQVLKQYIHQNGPVEASMYVDESEGFDNTYDGTFTFNYAALGPYTNHGVLIVGWSDDLPPVPGSATPADGWIVKNSWGTGWGDSGYFYMTYGAANIGMYSSSVHDWQDYDRKGDLWYYDEDGWSSTAGGLGTTMWGLARFTAPGNTSVTRVEFWTTDATTDVDVYLYDSFDGTEPSGLLAQVLNNSFGEAGYHSVPLAQPVDVSSGQEVVAVVKFTNVSYAYPLALDGYGPASRDTFWSLDGSSGSWDEVHRDTGYLDVAIRVRTSGLAAGPAVTSIAPDSEENTGLVHITNLAGSNFQRGATVKLNRPDQPKILATNVNVVSDSKITCDLDLTGAATGKWNVVVTNPDSQDAMLANGFKVTTPARDLAATSITPGSGENTGSVHVTNLAGSNFQSGATVMLNRPDQPKILATKVKVVSDSKITCDLDLTGAATGKWNVVVTNPDSQRAILANGFKVTAPVPSPAVVSIAPESGEKIGTIRIAKLAGRNFQSGAKVKLTRSGQPKILATNVDVESASRMTCQFDLIGAKTGRWNVVVTNPDSQSAILTNGFWVTAPGGLARVRLPLVTR